MGMDFTTCQNEINIGSHGKNKLLFKESAKNIFCAEKLPIKARSSSNTPSFYARRRLIVCFATCDYSFASALSRVHKTLCFSQKEETVLPFLYSLGEFHYCQVNIRNVFFFLVTPSSHDFQFDSSSCVL